MCDLNESELSLKCACLSLNSPLLALRWPSSVVSLWSLSFFIGGVTVSFGKLRALKSNLVVSLYPRAALDYFFSSL